MTGEGTPPRRRPRWLVPTAAALAGVLVATGGIFAVVSLTSGPTDGEIRAAEQRWGLSPDPDGGMELQPDVVVLEHGALAIEEVSADGLSWRLDAGYPGVSDIAEGELLFLTNRVVGRVGALTHPDGGGVEVTLIPVDLPEVVRNADFEIDQEVNEDDFVISEIDPYPGMLVDGQADDGEEGDDLADPDDVGGDGTGDPEPGADPSPSPEVPDPSPTASPAGYRAPAASPAPAPTPSERPKGFQDQGWEIEGKKISIAPWVVGFTATSTSVGFKGWIEQDGLVGGITGKLNYDHLRVYALSGIRNGEWRDKSTFLVSGFTGFDIAFGAGVQSLADNANFTLEIPIEYSLPMVVNGVPLELEMEMKFTFRTALSARNSTMLASGSYRLDGDLGMRMGEAVAPKVSVASPMIQSISAASLGIDGAVFGLKAKIGLGFGIKAVSIGPFGSFTATAGVLRGTALTAPWGVPCQVTLVISAGGGLGGKIDDHYLAALQKKLSLSIPPKLEFSILEKTKEVINRTVDMPICPAQTSADEAPRETPPVQKRQRDDDPYTAAGAPKPPGKGQQHPPRPAKPMTQGTENPNSGNADPVDGGGLSGGGTGGGSGSNGPKPPPRPAGEDDGYSLDSEYCDLQPDPRHTERDIYGNPTYFYCADWEPDVPRPEPSSPSDGPI
mgnify:CR=1 FL=1